AHQVNREPLINYVLIGLYVSASLLDVKLHGELAILGEREDMLRRVNHSHAGGLFHICGSDRASTTPNNAEDYRLHIIIQPEHKLLEVPDYLVHIFHHTGDGLVLVQHAVN